MKTKSLSAKRLVVLAMAMCFLATFVPQASAGPACCDITKIDARAGVVTAQDRSTGRTFQFTASPTVLQKVKVGQGVYANFKTRQLSLDGKNACCNIVNMGGAPPTTPGSLGGARAGTQIAPVDYARTKGTQALPPNDSRVSGNQILPVDGAKADGSQVIPPNDSTVSGNQILPVDGAKVDGSQAIPPEGSRVSGNQILPVDGAKVDGSQISPPNNFTKSGNQVSPPNDAKVGSSQVIPPEGARVGSNPVGPAPCCAITRIDTATGVATVTDKTTGHSFQFTASPSVQQGLQVGQPVYANFKTKQVSIDGRTAAGDIVSVPVAEVAPVDGFKAGTQIALSETGGLQTRQGKAPGGLGNGAGTNSNEASLPPCNQHHPGRQNRLESVAKSGDAHMAMSAAGHATLYAIQRFHMENLNFTQDDIKRAQKDLYEFLKWKLGNPAAIAAQFISAGYQHFDRAYSDEAAAALLGTDLPSEQNGAHMTLSPGFSAHLKLKIDELQQQGLAQEAIAVILSAELGPVGPIAFDIINQLTANGIDVVVHRVSVNVPKNWEIWDIDNRLVDAMIVAFTAPSTQPQTGTTATTALRPNKSQIERKPR